MLIRKAKSDEIDSIMEIYESARSYMARSGNATQWGNSYPQREIIISDIESGHCNVCVCDDNKIHGVFVLTEGDDPTYKHIRGAWRNDEPYLTVHRIASDGAYHGIFDECISYCKKKCRNIRIDTHENNAIMQYLINKNGFIRCGIINIASGAERIAYQFVGE